MENIISEIWSLPGARQLRESAVLNRILRKGYGPQWGSFKSRSEAEGFLRKAKRASYDSAEIVAINLEHFRKIHLFDWPVIYALQQLSAQVQLRSVVDFGGHVGAKFYAYRDVIKFDSDFKWHVVDVPAVCEEGRSRLKPGDESLIYSESTKNLTACDVLLCSGSLQYCSENIDEIIAKMPTRPRMVILNKVALSEDEFYTLEAFMGGRMPYRIMTQNHLDAVRTKAKYERSAQWKIPDMGFIAPHQKGANTVHMVGEIWVDEIEGGVGTFKAADQ